MTSKRLFNKLLKWVGYVFAAFVLLVIVAFAVALIKKDEIKQTILASFNERINGTLNIGEINFTIFHNFPNFSISIHDIVLYDSLKDVPVIQAKKMYADIGFRALFRNEIQLSELFLENSSIFLYKNVQGYSNTSVFRTNADTTSEKGSNENPYAFKLNALGSKNVLLTYVDSAQQKKIQFNLKDTYQTFESFDGITKTSLDGDIYCHELTFNSEAGSFLEKQSFRLNSNAEFNYHTKKLNVFPATLTLGKNVIQLKAEFVVKKEGDFSLHIGSDKLEVSEGLHLVNTRIKSALQKFRVDGPINIKVDIKGVLKKGNQPHANVVFDGVDVNFTFGKLKLTNLSCSAEYIHRPDSTAKRDELSKVVVNSFRAKLEGIDLKGKVSFKRLFDPVMDLSMQSSLTPKVFNDLVETTVWVCKSGKFVGNVTYKGRLEEYLDPTTPKYTGKLLGDFSAVNASFIYKPNDIKIEKVNADFSFDETQFTIKKLGVLLNSNPINISGLMKNYIPFFIQPVNKGYVKLDLQTPHLDLSFLAVDGKKSKMKNATEKRISKVFTAVQEKLKFDIHLAADNFVFKKFKAQNIKGDLSLTGRVLEAPRIEMDVAEGTMATRIFLRSDPDGHRLLTANADIGNADIKEFFMLFNDFNQRTITAENLAGKISATANFSAHIRDDLTVDAQSMRGNITCTIHDGKLLEFEPLQNVSNFLFKKRDFSEISFAELNSYFDINGTNLDIERMEVQSSVLSFFLQGRYSFTDSTSMSLQLPLNNLKKRDRDFKPENVGTDSKQGMSVYLHIFRDKDTDSKINIAYDPFKKWVKKD